MAKALTPLAIEKMKPPPTRREVPDGLVAGLYLVVQPSGAKSWAVRYRAAGAPRKHTLGSFPAIDLRAARDLARGALIEVAKGADPALTRKAAKAASRAEPAADHDLVDRVIDVFVERHAKLNTRADTARETERLLRREVLPSWGRRKLGTITRVDVNSLLDGIVDRGAPILANRVLAALRKMCGWAVDRGLIDASPCDRVRAPSAERSRDRVLADGELQLAMAAFDAIGWPFGPLFKLLALTGQRRDEVGSMRWSEVDLEGRLWTIPRERAKNHQAHAVPLSEAAVAILTALPRTGASVFSTNGKTPVSGFSKAKSRVDELMATAMVRRRADGATDLLPWVIHDLRRTAASGMARLGIPLPVIERVLNHVSGSFAGVVGVYQRHAYLDERVHALRTWSAHLDTLGKP